MIDFENNRVFKLSPVEPESQLSRVAPLLIEGERILAAYKAIRDAVVFTNKRVIAMNVQGITGKKVDYTSLPYSKIQAYSVETAGTFDLDSELDLFYSGVGKVRFEFRGSSDIIEIGRVIAKYALR